MPSVFEPPSSEDNSNNFLINHRDDTVTAQKARMSKGLDLASLGNND